jgi:proteic killer suppression protein
MFQNDKPRAGRALRAVLSIAVHMMETPVKVKLRMRDRDCRTSQRGYNELRYDNSMIKSFADAETEIIWSGRRSRKLPPDIQSTALRMLRMLNNARLLQDLRVPPGNRLEALSGNPAGEHSIRINEQWRICFNWQEGGPSDVEIVDYHD